MRIGFTLIWMICSCFVFAQQDSGKHFSFSGYAEVYYGYDINQPASGNRPGFVYSHNRHNEVNVNLAFLKGSYQAERLRANLALAAGTYMNVNYAAEPGVLKNLYESSIGYKLSKKDNLWLDAGVMPSHIGFESAIGKDCWTLTRSMMADNSPYYEAGVKLSYATRSEKLYLALFWLNGWQRIKRVEGNSTPNFGTRLTYKPSSRISLNWSSFIGNDKPDSTRQMRYFNNLYGQWAINEHWGLIAGFDIGFEQAGKGSSDVNTWYTPVIIARYQPHHQVAIASRFEYFSDQNKVLILPETGNAFQTAAYSLNVDYLPLANAAIRFEAKWYSSKEEAFLKNGKPVSNTAVFTLAIAAGF